MINVGVVGLGQSGWHLHAASLHAFSDYRVAAVCDQSPALLAKATDAFGAKPYADTAALFADSEVQLVVIATPNSLHASQAIAALEAGKDGVVDKPMAATLAEADQMVATAQRTGRMLTVFHNRRWDPDFQMLKALDERDILGDLLTLDSRIFMSGGLWGVWGQYGVPEFRPQWRLEAAYAGGYLADWGPHMVDQCLSLVDEWPLSVTGQLRSDLWSDEDDDYFSLRMIFPSGLIATLEASNNARLPPPRWFVVGRKGTLIAPGDFTKWTEIRVRAELDGIITELLPKDLGSGAMRRKYGTGKELSDYYYADLAEALRTGRPPAISADHARDVMIILDAARRSHAAGETVFLEERGGAEAEA